MGKCSVRTSVSVRRRALSMLLEHEVLGCMSRSRFVRSRKYSTTTPRTCIYIAALSNFLGGKPASSGSQVVLQSTRFNHELRFNTKLSFRVAF